MYVCIYIYITNCRQYCFGLLGLIIFFFCALTAETTQRNHQLCHISARTLLDFVPHIIKYPGG